MHFLIKYPNPSAPDGLIIMSEHSKTSRLGAAKQKPTASTIIVWVLCHRI